MPPTTPTPVCRQCGKLETDNIQHTSQHTHVPNAPPWQCHEFVSMTKPELTPADEATARELLRKVIAYVRTPGSAREDELVADIASALAARYSAGIVDAGASHVEAIRTLAVQHAADLAAARQEWAAAVREFLTVWDKWGPEVFPFKPLQRLRDLLAREG